MSLRIAMPSPTHNSNRLRNLSLVAILSVGALGTMLAYLVSGKGRTLDSGRIISASSKETPPKPAKREIVNSFRKNQTVSDALSENGMDEREVHKLVQSSHRVYNLARVRAGKYYWLTLGPDGEFLQFRYLVDDDQYLTVYRHDDEFVPVMKRLALEVRVLPISGVIRGSLIGALADCGESEATASEFAEIFGSDVDFYTDLQKGDSFHFLVEKKYLDGNLYRNGAILAADFHNRGKTFRGYRFDNGSGGFEYYGPEGKSLKKSFLKSPLKYGHITSHYSRTRFHPILKTVRPHLGVDYGAPEGTPVAAVGAGTVISAGVSGGSGKLIRLRHTGGLETSYLHLSRISVHSGAHVKQGDVIGYVGSTGLTTGPHLDFRVARHGVYINPTKVVFPPGPPVAKAALVRFALLRDSLDVRLQQRVY